MNALCKRILDLTLAIIGLIVTAPIMAVIAFLVWLDSPGKVIFAQERGGLHGRRFRMYKFRKFPVHWRDAGPGVTVAGDARMTRIGAILERTKLDELPQLWNILKGEMSFVGPRPESTHFSELFSGKYTAILEYVPGIFGPSQVAFRNESELYPADEDPEAYYRRVLFPKKAEHDLAYFQKANCLTDITWIIRGIWVSMVGVLNWQRFVATHVKILFIDAILIDISWTFANFLRFSGLPEGIDFDAFVSGLWIFPPILITGMFLGGCYSYPLRYFSLVDAIRLTWAISLVWLSGFILLIGSSSRNISLYLIPMGWFILLPLLTMPRIWLRIQREKYGVRRSVPSRHIQILIYGVGNTGLALANWLRNEPRGLHLLGFLDDDPEFRKKIIYGYRVLGRESDIPTIHQVHHINEIWVTFQPDELKRYRLRALCEKLDIKLVVIMELEPFLDQGQHVKSA
jgi:lipopolysaccharide/colanic/teichoic acid biosynthesis glycosyltransferase